MQVKKVVVIGCGLAGLAAAEAARLSDKNVEIAVIDSSFDAPYSRCGLPYLISGKVSSQDLKLRDRKYFESLSIRLISGRTAAFIDRERRRVVLDSPEGVEGEDYDKLIIATGSTKGLVNIPGAEKRGLFRLFSIDDAEDIRRAAKNSKSALVIGSGPVAILISEQLSNMKIKTTLSCQGALLDGLLDKKVSELLISYLTEHGIDVVSGKRIANFVGFNRIQGIVLDGRVLTADMVILTGQLIPNTDLAKNCGLKISKSGRIMVDNSAYTSDENILAAGDCSEIHSSILDQNIPLQPASLALKSGIVAGTNAVGGSASLSNIVGNISFRFDGIDICSIGVTEEEARQKWMKISVHESSVYQFASYYPGGKELYTRLIVNEGNQLIGAQLVGPSAAVWGNLISMIISRSLPLTYLADLETSFSPTVQPYYPSPVLAAKSALSHKEF